MLPIRLLSGLVLLISLTGCSTYKGMFFAEHTHVGAQIKISPETDAKPLDVNIGYDRGLLAVVPRTAPGENAGSAISKTDLDIVFMTNSTVKNVFATGVAAKNLARDGANVAALFSQCYDETDDLRKRKQGALSKLAKTRDNKTKIEALYKNVFPTKTIHWTTTQGEMLRELGARINAICNSKNDDSTLTLYENL